MPRLPDHRFAPDCTIELDGRPVPARAGESAAVALLAAGHALVARSAKYHRPRGAFCLAGSCHACLARVDGVASARLCRVPCRPGLAIETQNAIPGAAHDLLGAIDLAYARGLDHHHLATWSRLANRAAVAFARRLAGVGAPPDAAPEPVPPAAEERFDAVVVGAGPAGLGAAERLAAGGRRVLLADAERRPGGRLRCALGLPGDPPLSWADEVARLVAGAGGEVLLDAAVLGLWMDGGTARLAVRVGELRPALRLVRAPRVVAATGSWAVPPLVPRNDLPGVLAARGLARALADDGVLAGRRAAVLGAGAEATAIAERLAAAGMEVRPVAEVTEARGGRRLAGVVAAGAGRVACDVLACAGPRAPASELARAAGARAVPDGASGGWHVAADGDGATGVAGLWAAGEVARACTAREAADAGRRAGEAAHRSGPGGAGA